MSIETLYKCDVCGAVRGESNHWFAVGKLTGAIVVIQWDRAILEGATHICGQKCAHALLDRWLATGSLTLTREADFGGVGLDQPAAEPIQEA